jgi:hypothetical protein
MSGVRRFRSATGDLLRAPRNDEMRMCPGRGAAPLWRCAAEPGPPPHPTRWTPDRQRTTPQGRRIAQHPGHALTICATGIEKATSARRANHRRLVRPSFPCPALAAKIFLFFRNANHRYISLVPSSSRGAFRDRHGRWERDAMDAGRAMDERVALRTAKSCGPDAPTLASSSREAKLLGGDGGKQARSPRRARRKPLKPLRRGCRVIPVDL